MKTQGTQMERNEPKAGISGAETTQETAENRASGCIHIAGVTGSSPVPSTLKSNTYAEKIQNSFVRIDQGKFWSRVRKSADGGCWEWIGPKFKAGYGQISGGGTLAYAHRYSLYLVTGSLPEGTHVCHRCDNPGCVNPAHLFLGDAKVNSDDKRQKLRKQRKITGSQAISIYKAEGAIKDIAEAHGVSRDLVEKIKNGTAWADVTSAPLKLSEFKQWCLENGIDL